MLRAIIITLTLLLGCGSSPTVQGIKNPERLNVEGIWKQALEIGGGNPSWTMIPDITIVGKAVVMPDNVCPNMVDDEVCRHWGEIRAKMTISKEGLVYVDEDIYVYVLSNEHKRIPNILLHEFLHAVWFRRTSEEGFVEKYPDTEAWVREVLEQNSLSNTGQTSHVHW
jgi:hypothetical protein